MSDAGSKRALIERFWTSLGLKRVTVVHYDDEVGKQNLEVVVNYLKKINLAPQAFPLKRNAQVGKPEIQALIAQQPELILTTVLSGAAAQMQKSLVEMGRDMERLSNLVLDDDGDEVPAGGRASLARHRVACCEPAERTENGFHVDQFAHSVTLPIASPKAVRSSPRRSGLRPRR